MDKQIYAVPFSADQLGHVLKMDGAPDSFTEGVVAALGQIDDGHDLFFLIKKGEINDNPFPLITPLRSYEAGNPGEDMQCIMLDLPDNLIAYLTTPVDTAKAEKERMTENVMSKFIH